MRIAVLADIHGNLIAFEAALADLRQQGVDQIILAGDVVSGAPDSRECWDLAVSLGCPIVRGNHERYVYTYGQPNMPAEWTGQQYLPIVWAHQHTTADQHTVMAGLPMSYSPPGYERELLITHATLRDDHDAVNARTTDAHFEAMFPDSMLGGDVPLLIVRAHNHIANSYAWGGRKVVTIGSCGLPLDHETTVQYAILTRSPDARWNVEHRSIPYDLDAALRRFHHSGYLDATGPIGRLFHREVATASYQILPFLRWYKRWQREGPISLDDAYVRFLSGLI
jgi:predicted phosphodiesterase